MKPMPKITHCKGCGREFKLIPALIDERKYCHRATRYGGWCDDKRCIAIRRINNLDPQPKIRFKGVKAHCTENVIKAVEKGWQK